MRVEGIMCVVSQGCKRAVEVPAIIRGVVGNFSLG